MGNGAARDRPERARPPAAQVGGNRDHRRAAGHAATASTTAGVPYKEGTAEELADRRVDELITLRGPVRQHGSRRSTAWRCSTGASCRPTGTSS